MAIPGIGGAIGGFASGFGDSYFGGKQDARNRENDFAAGAREYEYKNPNAALYSAFDRNKKGNILQNLAGKGNFSFGGGDGKSSFLDIVGQSLTGGINPDIINEMHNISDVPGMRIGGEYTRDPAEMFKAQKAGFGESLAAGGLKALGGFFGG